MKSLVLLLLLSAPAQAWNALGHKVIADIAWQELTPERRQEIVAIIRRHPRFDKDFQDLESDWDTFCHAATWPDIARGIRGPEREKYDHPIWHYVNFPFTVDGFPAPKRNLSSNPKDNKAIAWNVMQATAFCQSVIASDAPPKEKALAYCWLMHLVGDLHQPLHSTALFSDRFPDGDRGGNSIKLVKGNNLHSLWDGLLGRSHRPNDVRREVAQLKERQELWQVDTAGDVPSWVKESHELAKSFVYAPEILANLGEPVLLREEYLQDAGQHARARVVAAGLRLGKLLAQKNARASD